MSLEQDLASLTDNTEYKDITTYLLVLLKDMPVKEYLLDYQYLMDSEYKNQLRGFYNNDNRHKSNPAKSEEVNNGTSIKDWARSRGVIVST